VVAPNGSVDRARLAAVVFSDPAQLKTLNSIVHPGVLRELDRQLDRLAAKDPQGVAVVEAALLIESGYHARLDRLVLCICTIEQQLERLTNPSFGRAMPREQAEKRIAAQMPLEEKRKLPHDEIDCSGSLDYTQKQVRTLVDDLMQAAAAPAR
jgi:dephospho-CoA kinase